MNESISWLELIEQSHFAGRNENYAEALRLGREAVQWAERQFGKNAYELFISWMAVYNAARFNQQPNVVQEAQAALKTLEKSMDSTIFKADRHADEQQDRQSAIPGYEAALKELETKQGLNSTDSAYLCRDLGLIHANSGEPKAAIPYLERAVKGLESHLGPRHVDVATALEDLARAYGHQGNFEVGPEGPNPPTDPSQYSAKAKDFYEKAATACARALAIREGHGEKDDSRLYYLLTLQAGVLRKLGRVSEAEPLEKRAQRNIA